METRARIEGLRQFLIHDQPYTQIYYSHLDDPESIHQTRMASSDLPEGLQVGENVTIYAVLGIVAEIRRETDGDDIQ